MNQLQTTHSDPSVARTRSAGARPGLRALGARTLSRCAALAAAAPLLLLAVVPIAALGLGSCASTGVDGSLVARVTMRQFGSNPQTFELRSESHTAPLDYYSETRNDASVKIVPDPDMNWLLLDLENLEFDRYAAPGPGPSSGLGGATKVVEVERNGRTRHVASHPNASAEQRSAVVQMVFYLTAAYSNVQGFQSVERNGDGADRVFTGPGLDG